MAAVAALFLPVVLRASVRTGRGSGIVVGAVALILKPVPNVSAGRAIARTGRQFSFWLKDNG
jgi:hypothetical protein